MSLLPARLSSLHACLRLLVVFALTAVFAAPLGGSAAAHSPADNVPPADIAVCRSTGRVETVPFPTYVKEVLAKEFPSTAPAETLKAGAVVVKSYAWYYLTRPHRPGTCHLTDSPRHQRYAPEDPTPARTDRTDGAVAATWHVRIEELRDGEAVPAFAQYCTACSGFPPGEHLDQSHAREQGQAGWSWYAIVRAAYHNKDRLRVFDWRRGLGAALEGSSPHPAAGELVAEVEGVAAGYPGARAHLLVRCTRDGKSGVHRLQSVGISAGEDRPAAVFDQVERAHACAEREVPAFVHLRVNGYLVGRDVTELVAP